MPGKKRKSAKAVIGLRNGGAAIPNGKQGSELWGSCATAWFRYIRPPGSGFLRKRQNQLPISLTTFPHKRGIAAGESELGSGESVKRARGSNEGRKRGDGHLPSASQSNHFPNLLFCSAAVPADGPNNVRQDPGRSLWGQE